MDMSTIPTARLVEELEHRLGVETYQVDLEDAYRLETKGVVEEGAGPAIIMVVVD
jgi:hypothetical protein